MKWKSGWGCVLCAWALVFGTAGPLRALDIADFLDLEPGNSWEFMGSLTVAGMAPSTMTGSIEIRALSEPPEPGAVEMAIELTGIQVPLAMQQSLVFSMTDETLYLHSREGVATYSGFPIDTDEEVYLTPAAVLPRHVYIGETYDYTADLSTGPVEDAMVIEAVETVTTWDAGDVESIRVVFFSEDETPVKLWMARGVGFTRVRVQATVEIMMMEKLATLNCVLSTGGSPLAPEPVEGLWSDTLRLPEGWRGTDWMGDMWAPDIDSPWISHFGLGWTYCFGDESAFLFYIPDLGWFWTYAGLFPYVYSYSRDEFLMHSGRFRSYLFWSFLEMDYISLAP